MITLENAVFEIHGDCVLALNWYAQLNKDDKQKFIDSLGIHRAEYIRDFTVDALWYIAEFGENGFDTDALTDLWQRIRNRIGREERNASN